MLNVSENNELHGVTEGARQPIDNMSIVDKAAQADTTGTLLDTNAEAAKLATRKRRGCHL